MTYGLVMPGQFFRSRDGLHGFEPGPVLFQPEHAPLSLAEARQGTAGIMDASGRGAERILCSRIDISGDWHGWKESAPVEVLRPELSWEGADAPIVPSVRSTAYGHVNQLRDRG
jgi:hypothetical protein